MSARGVPPIEDPSDTERIDLARHKSRLLCEARLMSEVDPVYAANLFRQVAQFEEQLATRATTEGGSGPTRNDHMVSAASCYVLCGDMENAKRIMNSGIDIPTSLIDLVRKTRIK